MRTIENSRAYKLDAALRRHHVAPEDAEAIMAGCQDIKKGDRRTLRAWAESAMRAMDGRLDAETRRKVRESCACCLGGKRRDLAKAICNDHETLGERVAALGNTRLIVGHAAELLPNGRVRVRFAEGVEDAYCPCLPLDEKPMSPTWCQCCGGHMRTHVETALGIKTRCTMVSTMLTTGGKAPCVFDFEIMAPDVAEGAKRDST